MFKKIISFLLVLALLSVSTSAYALNNQNSENIKDNSIAIKTIETNSSNDYNNFLKDVENFKQFKKSQKLKQGTLSNDDFELKCAIEYYNQKVKNGQLTGPLLNPNDFITVKTNKSISAQTNVTTLYYDKYSVRAQLWVASLMISPILPRTAYFFQHSLNDNPSDVYLGSSNPIVPEIKATNAYKSVIATFKRSGSSYQRNPLIFTPSNASWDLYLALHYTTIYSYSSGKSITSYVTDTYDFQPKNWGGYGSGIPDAAVTLINNYGVYAQSVGAVVPYYISITIPDTK
ncbi:hypothetical protein ACETAC_01865 [Aceticella autotrophica]|uniref:Uncharacterized protein n=1 Tax=Aceticella autotrophica TaxID=2755338 RepID=A0A975AWC9_9THEO|nr:hypothetical protein [Aceticella autotrophica]QSZ27675.1 hypothetical protein ACETAC_01865 [Aceticella autotrophica]